MSTELPPPRPRVAPKLIRAPFAPPRRPLDPLLGRDRNDDITGEIDITVEVAEVVSRQPTRRERLAAIRAFSIPTAIVRRFFQIDGIRKAMLMAFNLFISIIPLIIIFFAFMARLRPNITLAQVFIENFRLKGEAAAIVRGALPSTRNVMKVASAIAIVSFAISGFDVASVFQRTFADAWNTKRLSGWRGPLRGAIWFMLVFATFAFSQMLQRGPAKFGIWTWFVTVPIIASMNYWFWIITPRLLLDKKLDHADLRTGALWGTFGSTVLWVLSWVLLPGWFGWYGRGFGGVGIALALLSWTYVVSIVWVVIVVIAAVMWERSATLDEVEEVADLEQLHA